MIIKPMPRLEKVNEIFLLIVISPLLLLSGAIMACILGVWALKRKLLGPRTGWSRWFAWYPVRLGNWHGPLVWLEWVERRAPNLWAEIDYRAPDSS